MTISRPLLEQPVLEDVRTAAEGDKWWWWWQGRHQRFSARGDGRVAPAGGEAGKLELMGSAVLGGVRESTVDGEVGFLVYPDRDDVAGSSSKMGPGYMTVLLRI